MLAVTSHPSQGGFITLSAFPLRIVWRLVIRLGCSECFVHMSVLESPMCYLTRESWEDGQDCYLLL